jgi:hypothetical protein
MDQIAIVLQGRISSLPCNSHRLSIGRLENLPDIDW